MIDAVKTAIKLGYRHLDGAESKLYFLFLLNVVLVLGLDVN